MALLTALRLWMQSAQKVYVANSEADDALFIKEAMSLISGKWLGGYDQLRLVKGPGYPLFVALVSALHVPLLLAQQLFCHAVYWVVVFAVRPVIRSTAALLLVFAFFTFSPVNMGPGTWFVLRDAIYPEQCMLVAAALFGVCTRLTARYRVQWGWGLLAGFALGWVYLSREEALWVAPIAGLMMVTTVAGAWRLRKRIGRWHWAAVTAVPACVAVTIVLIISTINWGHYGLFGVVEFKEKNFRAAVGALSRVKPTAWQPMVPVPRELWPKLYEASPAFRELQPYLEGTARRPADSPVMPGTPINLGELWAAESAAATEGLPHSTRSTGEIAGGYWIWAVRDAAAWAGHHQPSAREASAYYRRLADEINAAVDSGKLPGGPRRSGISPVWRWEYLGLMWKEIPRLWREEVGLLQETPNPEYFQSRGDEKVLTTYRRFLHQDVFPLDAEAAQAAQQAYLKDPRYLAADAIYRAYHAAATYVLALGAFSFLALLLLPQIRRDRWVLLVFIAGIAASAAVRCGLLLYLDVSSFRAADNSRYISAAQMYLMLAEILAIAGVLDGVRRWRQDRRAARG